MRANALSQIWRSDNPSKKLVFVVADDTSGEPVECRATFGEFLRAYIDHLTMPWWKKLWWINEWHYVERKMRRILDDHADVVWAERA